MLLLALPLSAQKKGYETGYIITLEGDTLRGSVMDRSPEPFVGLYSRIRFRPHGEKRRLKYRAEQLRGYAAGGRVYESARLREETAFFRFRYFFDPGAEAVFLKVVRRDGPLTWYEQEFVHDDNDFVDFIPLFHKKGTPELVRVTQGLFGLKKQRLSEYFSDCPGMEDALSEGRLQTPEDVYEYYLDSCVPRKAGSLSEGIYRIAETGSGMLQTSSRTPLEARLQALRVPGVSIAVIDGYEIREVLFYGRTGNHAKVNRQTLFQAASVSKMVTALLVHHYVALGMLDLDKDVNTYLASWKIPENPFSRQRPVTLRLLLSHQSGLPGTNFDFPSNRPHPSLNQILDGAYPAGNKPAVPQAVPGEEWTYSNIGYVLVQKILEDRIGKPFQDLAREVLFEPAGMDLSTFDYPLPEALAKNEALPHDASGQPRAPELDSPVKAQGGLLTTPEELARLVLEVMKASKWESEMFPKPLADGLLQPERALPFKMYGQPVRMGLGALLFGEGKEIAFVHNGYNSPGSVCIAVGFPYMGKGAVIAANGANGEALYLEILATLAEAYAWPTGQFFKP